MDIDLNWPGLHPVQKAIDADPSKRVMLVLGRRTGKSVYLGLRAARAMIAGERVGLFTPLRSHGKDILTSVEDLLWPLKPKFNRSEGAIELLNGGRLESFSLENVNAGRGKRFHLALCDELSLGKPSDAIGGGVKATIEQAVLLSIPALHDRSFREHDQ